MGMLKDTAVQCTIALCAAFATVAATADEAAPTTRLAQASQGSPAAQIASALYNKPTNDFTLNAAKRELLQLPASQIGEARSAYHKLANDERSLARTVAPSLAAADGKHTLDEIKSPEIRAALAGGVQQIASDKSKGDNKTTPYDRMWSLIPKIDADSHTREEAFQTVVKEALTEKRALEKKQALGS